MFAEKNESKVEMVSEPEHSHEVESINNTQMSKNNNSDSNSSHSNSHGAPSDLEIIIICVLFMMFPCLPLIMHCCFDKSSDKSNDKKPLLSKSNRNYNEVVNDTTETIDDYNNLLTSIRNLISAANENRMQVNRIPNHLDHYMNSDEYKTIHSNIDNSTYNQLFIINSKIIT